MIISVIFSLFAKVWTFHVGSVTKNNHKFIIIAQNPWIVKKIGVFFSDW